MAIENTRLFSSAQRQYLRAEKLLHGITIAQEDERKRIAVEIHDSVAQWMVGASYDIKVCSTLISESRFADLELELDKIRKTLQRSTKELRRAIANLHPPPSEKRGLVGTLCQAVEMLNEEGIRCSLEVDSKLPKLYLC